VKGYVIIGGGVAAVGCVEGIRTQDVRTPITLVSQESYLVYGRPLIVEVLKGERTAEDILYREPAYYDQMRVKVMLGQEAKAIDTQARTVELASGEKLAYKRLLIATGGVPIIVPMEGLEGPDLYTFTTLDDAKRLSEAVPGMKEVVVIGGGLIGLKVAEGLHDRGVHVTIVELAPRILSAAFDDAAGRIISGRLNEVGLKVLCNCSVKAILRGEQGRVRGVRLSDGRELACQAVVAAIGVAPNKALAQRSGLKVNRGVVVDHYLRTSASGVYAAGDVAEAYDISIKGYRVVPIWSNAYLQGYGAGRNMAGARAKYAGGLPMNSIAFYGIPTISAGVTNPPNGGFEVLQRLEPERHYYRKLVLKRGRLAGYVLVGEVKRAGLLTGLIKEAVEVAGFKERLLNDGLSYLDLPEDLRRERLS
jgi:NAD(P)H-nitrite reductase large subunit